MRYFIAHAIISQVYSKRIIVSPARETWSDLEAERIGTRLETGPLTFLKGEKNWTGRHRSAGMAPLSPTKIVGEQSQGMAIGRS